MSAWRTGVFAIRPHLQGMSENDQYPRHRRDSKKPVTLLLLALLVAGIAAFFYETMDAPRPTATPATTSGPAQTPAPGAANPNALVPPGSGSQSPASP